MSKHFTLARRSNQAAAVVFTVLSLACARLTEVPDPTTVLDPRIIETPAGAIKVYNSAMTRFGTTFASGTTFGSPFPTIVSASGVGSDEYTARFPLAAFATRRVGPGGSDDGLHPYSGMHSTLMTIEQAIGALKQYGGTTTPSFYIAELYAIRGFIYIQFAEMYCSGVPFSRVVYGGDVVIGGGKTTAEMLTDAVANMDSALAITTDSANIRQLAYVGKARALLNLGRFAEAAEVASTANVPDGFTYAIQYTNQRPNYLAEASSSNFGVVYTLYMANHSGGNGLNYVTAGDPAGGNDPRVAWFWRTGVGAYPLKFRNIAAAIPLASSIEARLIEAEAKLQAEDYDGWSSLLNTLRQTALATPIHTLSADSTTNANLTLRQDVMFRERAFWLYGTGHRMGDMRRLIRQYQRRATQVFPMGVETLLPAPDNVYSNDPNFAPPLAEIQNNSKYRGCFNRDA